MIQEEKLKYEQMWAIEQYRETSPGLNAAKHFEHYLKPGESLIDFGCGTGLASVYFLTKGLSIQMVDIASNCLNEQVLNVMSLFPHAIQFTGSALWDLPKTLKKADWIYCCDVLEHIPEEFVDAALMEMAKLTLKGGFFQIALEDEPWGDLIQKKLHMTVRPKEWWMEKIEKLWEVKGFGPDEFNGFRFTVFLGKLQL